MIIALAIMGILFFGTRMNRNNFIAATGQFGIGTASYHLVDTKRQETNVASGGARELMLQIWYPAALQKEPHYMPYSEDALANMKEFISISSKFPAWLFSGLRGILTHSYAGNVPVASDNESYPVIILLHGSGTMITHYAWIAEELASHGYIVIGINHPYVAAVTRFADNRLIKSLVNEKKKQGKEISKAWKQEQFEVAVQDISFVIDNLSAINEQVSLPFGHKLDLEHIGICGHSSGGSLAMRMCLEDNRIKAGISLDGSIRGNEELTPFATPFLVITAEKSHVREGQEGLQMVASLNQLCRKPGMQMTIMTFKGIGHGTFTDLPILLNTTLFTRLLSHVIHVDVNTSSVHACRAIEKIKTYLNDFFGQYLKGQSTRLFSHPKCDMIMQVD